MIACFTPLPSLRTLRLSQLTLTPDEAAPLLLLLPSTLTFLGIRDSAIGEKEVLQYLEELPPRQGFALEVKRRMKTRKEVQEACSKAGVGLR